MKYYLLVPICALLLWSCSIDTHPNLDCNGFCISSIQQDLDSLSLLYGVSISINDAILEKRKPSTEQIEKFIIRSKKEFESMHLDAKQMLSTTTTTITKSRTEYDPPLDGQFSDTYSFYVPYEYKFDVELKVVWHYGGNGQPNYVNYEGSVEEEYMHLYSNAYTELVNPYYSYSGKNFIGTVTMNYRRRYVQELPIATIFADVSYNHYYGVGIIYFTLISANTCQ